MPVKLSLSKPAQVLLTNLQLASTPSVLRTVRLAASETYANFNLDFTVGEGSTGPVAVALDVGDNGSIDWTPASGQSAPVRLTTGNLATAINSYLAGRSGEVDVPVRIYVSPLSTVRLNDFSATIAPKIDLVANSISASAGVVTAANTDSMLINAGDNVTLQATLGNSGGASGAVTAAFFATAAGWGDWYIGSAFVANIPSGGSAPVSVVWNTTGFSGTVPVKVVINPYCRVAETNCKNNSKSTTVTVNPPLTIPLAPSNLVTTSVSLTQINLTWADNSNNETGFKLERSSDGANGWTQIAVTSANVATYANTGLTCGITYYYRCAPTMLAAIQPIATLPTPCRRVQHLHHPATWLLRWLDRPRST